MAIGEIGLDYYYDLSERSVQREVFEKQLILAKEYDVPFILHERDATGDLCRGDTPGPCSCRVCIDAVPRRCRAEGGGRN